MPILLFKHTLNCENTRENTASNTIHCEMNINGFKVHCCAGLCAVRQDTVQLTILNLKSERWKFLKEVFSGNVIHFHLYKFTDENTFYTSASASASVQFIRFALVFFRADIQLKRCAVSFAPSSHSLCVSRTLFYDLFKKAVRLISWKTFSNDIKAFVDYR